MKIPDEILLKYSVLPPEQWEHFGYETEEEKAFLNELVYRQFLNATDYEITRGYDKLLSEPLKFLTNLATLAKSLKEVCEYRQIAREEIEKLEKQA